MMKNFRMFDPKSFLKFLLMPAHEKERKFNEKQKKEFIAANNKWNSLVYEDEKALNYDEMHEYSDDKFLVVEVKKILKEILSNNNINSVLEVGAGTGYYTKYYSDYVKSLTALELGKDLVKVLKKNLKNTKCIVISQDIRNFKSNEKYDVILFINTIHHIPFRLELLKNLKNNLKEQGMFVFIEPEHNWLRILSLLRKYKTKYSKRNLSSATELWGGHDFLSHKEVKYYAKKLNAKYSVRSFDSYLLPDNIKKYERYYLKIPFFHNMGRNVVATIKFD